MGTCRLLDELVARGASRRYDITVFGEEHGGAYNRILLGQGARPAKPPDDIVTKPPSWYDRHGIRLLDAHARRRALDTLRKTVETEDGQRRALRRRRARHRQPAARAAARRHERRGRRAAPGRVRVPHHRRLPAHARATRARATARSWWAAACSGSRPPRCCATAACTSPWCTLAKTLMNAQLDALGGEMLQRQIERARHLRAHGPHRRGRRRRRSASRACILDDGTHAARRHGGARVRRAAARRRGARLGPAGEQRHHRQRHARHGGARRVRLRRVRRARGRIYGIVAPGLGAGHGAGRRADRREPAARATAARSCTRG